MFRYGLYRGLWSLFGLTGGLSRLTGRCVISSQLIVKICRAGISNGSQGGDNTGVRKEGAVPAILPPIPLPPFSSEPCPPLHRSRASTPLYTLSRAPPNLSTTPPLSTLLSLCLVRFFIVVCFLPLCTAILLQPKPTREPPPSTPRSPTPSSSSVLPPLPLVLTGFPLSLLHLSFQSFLLLPQDGKARGEKAVGVWRGMGGRATGGPGVEIRGGDVETLRIAVERVQERETSTSPAPRPYIPRWVVLFYRLARPSSPSSPAIPPLVCLRPIPVPHLSTRMYWSMHCMA